MFFFPFCRDFVFGNESEADAFAAANEFGTKDVKEIATKIAQMPKVGSEGREGRGGEERRGGLRS